MVQYRVLNEVFSLAKCHDNLPVNVENLLSQNLQMLVFYLLGEKRRDKKTQSNQSTRVNRTPQF